MTYFVMSTLPKMQDVQCFARIIKQCVIDNMFKCCKVCLHKIALQATE